MSARRTCVACRGEEDRADLVRLALAPDGRLVVDYRGRLPGRGAWVHPRRACVDEVVRHPGRLHHALRAKGLETADLSGQLRAAIDRAVADGLSLAAAGGALVAGFEALTRALGAGEVVEIAVASDAAERTVRQLRSAAGEDVPFTALPLDREALGSRVGRGPIAAVGVAPVGPSVHLRRQLRRSRELG